MASVPDRSLSDPSVTDLTVFERYRPLIDDWEAFCAALRRPLPVCVWANSLRLTASELAAHMAATGLDARPLHWWPNAFRLRDFDPGSGAGPGARFEYIAGLYHVQEEVSLLPPRLLDPRPGERILDLCAAPGGKTAQIAVALGNQGTVVANDRDFGRLTTLRSTLDRLGAANVTTTRCDGANYPPEAGLFDRVLVDVPCSCEGTSRKSPEVLAQVGPAVSRRLEGVQRGLLRKAIQLTRPGGRIVYSTCTYAPEENEEVVADLLAEHPDVRLKEVAIPGLQVAPGLTEWEGREYPPEMKRAVRIWPHHNDTGGFFVAVLEKAPASEIPGGERESPERVYGVPPVEEQPGFEAAEPGRWHSYLADRFDFAPEVLEGFHVFRRNRRMLGIVARGHLPPPRPEPQSVGMPFLYPDMRFPKLSTAGSRLVAPGVRTGRVETTAGQADAYLRRRIFRLEPEQRQALTGPGFVLVFHAGHALSLGLAYRPHAAASDSSPEGESDLEIESLSPKRWAEAAVGGALPGLRASL